MKKTILLITVALLLSNCSLFRVHKVDIEQGNVITSENVSRLHTGMSAAQVKEVMGSPILMNIFTPNRMEYVYTFQKGHGSMQEKRVSVIFSQGRVVDIVKSM